MVVTKCPTCGGDRLFVFLQRSHVPVHQNLVVPDQHAARAVNRGDLSLAVCDSCGFVFNQAFDLAKVAYGEDYDNTQSCSPLFDAYLDGLVKDLVEAKNVRHSTVVEVGCGRGQFLCKLVIYPNSGNRGVGFDPSYVGPESDLDGRLLFRRSYYDEACTDVAADVVVCRHVIEHVPDPLALLRSVKLALRNAPNARVFFETPCVDWILTNRVVWDFFYEHCSLFSQYSLSLLFQRAGFQVMSVKHVFDGQYLWLEASVSADVRTQFYPNGQETTSLARAYGGEEQARRMRWQHRLETLRQHGKVALWGAGAKGATLANLVDPECSLLDCVVDINPNKQGRFIPGTGHPIIPPEELAKRSIKSVILMNPNYRAENQQLVSDANIRVNLIDWND